MTFRQLAIRNVRSNLRRYAAFFLSSGFSVTIFYLYAQFIYHPAVADGKFAMPGVQKGLIACEYIIAIFSFFFLLYSLTAFLRSRTKEFGLLSLFGMTPNQIRNMVMLETMWIGVLSTAVGIACGLLFSKLFLMAMSVMLDVSSPIPFAVVWPAIGLTAGLYMGMFFVLALSTMLRIGSKTVVEQLRESRKPKSPPKPSWLLAVLGVGTIVAGYVLAYGSTPQMIGILFFPVIGLTVFGSYFLFTQGSVAFIRLLGRRNSHWRGVNLLVEGQLQFKLKDNARMLFSVTILSAIVLSASGTFYIFFQDLIDKTNAQYPQTMAWHEQGEAGARPKLEAEVLRRMEASGVRVNKSFAIDSAEVYIRNDGKAAGESGRMYSVAAVRQSDLIKLGLISAEEAKASAGQAVLVSSDKFSDLWETREGTTLSVWSGREDKQSLMEIASSGRFTRYLYTSMGLTYDWMVLSDEDYSRIEAAAPGEMRTTTYAIDIADWENQLKLENELRSEVFGPADKRLHFKTSAYLDVKQMTSLTLFVGLFVSILFFLAAGSMIYFKMFTELREEQALYRSLARIGLTQSEMKRIVRRQLRVIFFVPFAIGALHAAFALKALANLLMSNIWLYAATVLGVFFVLQFAYYVLSQRVYLREIMRDRAA